MPDIHKVHGSQPVSARSGGLSVDDIKQGLSHISESGFEDGVMANGVPPKIEAAFQKLEPGQDDVSEFYKVAVKGHTLFVSNTDTANGQVLHVFDGNTGKPLLSGTFHTDGEPVAWTAGNSSGTRVGVGNVKGTQVQLPDALQLLMMNNKNVDCPPMAGSFKFSPADLKKATANPAAQKNFAHDIIWNSMKSYGGNDVMGRALVNTDSLTLTPLAGKAVADDLAKTFGTTFNSPLDPKNASALQSFLTAHPDATFQHVAWDNGDDANAEGIIATAKDGSVAFAGIHNTP